MAFSSSRTSITDILKEKLGEEDAVIFEKEIYEMCVRLSEETEDPLEALYEHFSYEKVGDIMSTTSGAELDKVLQDIQSDVLGWDSSIYENFRKRMDADNSMLTRNLVTEVSIHKCKSKDCGSRECIQTSLQTRSGDEPATIFVTCMKCGQRNRLDS